MHLQEHSLSSSTQNRGKTIFPMPLTGQTLMFSNPGCPSAKCDQGGRTHHTTISPKPTKSRCSCEGNTTSLTSYNRLLLPAVSQKDHSSSLGNSFTDAWLRIPPVGRSNYESFLLNGFPLYGRLNGDSIPSLDYASLSNARRKNATRETTNTLKAWLNDHKKNPYPTKSEKIMLAIVTKMTLTQVSTWFANARRRLKKENKMTWLPKKKSGEKKDKANSNSCGSESDDDNMDIDITNDDNSLHQNTTPDAETTIDLNTQISEGTIQRPSVIRAVESPTFNEIRDRFKDAESPVHNLQNWVNGCFKHKPCNDDLNDFPKALTPPTTPIENQVTTFSSQKLFEAYDANKSKTINEMLDTPKPSSSYSDEPLEVIFSSRQPVFSIKENKDEASDKLTDTVTISNGITTINGVITPQPSPKNTSEFFKKISTPKSQSLSLPVFTGLSKPCNTASTSPEPVELQKRADDVIKKDDNTTKNEEDSNCDCEKKPSNFRVQGLTTSRELEAVLALTNLHKT